MAKFLCSLTIFIVSVSVLESAQIFRFFSTNLFDQSTKNDAKNDRRMDKDSRRIAQDELKAITNVKETLKSIEELINRNKNTQESFRISQINKPDQKLHIYNPNIFFPEVIGALENNTSAYSDVPMQTPPSVVNDLKRNSIASIFQKLYQTQNFENVVGNNTEPVTALEELLRYQGTVPKYELVQIKESYQPLFWYKVSVKDFVALGSGKSKRDAKQAAARSALEKLTGRSNTINNIDEQILINMAIPVNDIQQNPISLLQELCTSRGWPPPGYQIEQEEGLPNEKQFTISCTLFGLKETGTGKSKQLAKREAASKMWNKLKAWDLPKGAKPLFYALGESDLGVALDEASWMSRSSQKVNLLPQFSPKKIVKRMAQQETKAKKLKRLQRARVKRRRKQRKRTKHLRKIGKLPKKKGDGGLNKVKKIYKRYRRGNSTHSFRNLTRTTTERILLKSETVEESVIPRWAPDGGNSTENRTGEMLGENDVKNYESSTVETSDENDKDSRDDESYDENDSLFDLSSEGRSKSEDMSKSEDRRKSKNGDSEDKSDSKHENYSDDEISSSDHETDSNDKSDSSGDEDYDSLSERNESDSKKNHKDQKKEPKKNKKVKKKTSGKEGHYKMKDDNKFKLKKKLNILVTDKTVDKKNKNLRHSKNNNLETKDSKSITNKKKIKGLNIEQTINNQNSVKTKDISDNDNNSILNTKITDTKIHVKHENKFKSDENNNLNSHKEQSITNTGEMSGLVEMKTNKLESNNNKEKIYSKVNIKSQMAVKNTNNEVEGKLKENHNENKYVPNKNKMDIEGSNIHSVKDKVLQEVQQKTDNNHKSKLNKNRSTKALTENNEKNDLKIELLKTQNEDQDAKNMERISNFNPIIIAGKHKIGDNIKRIRPVH